MVRNINYISVDLEMTNKKAIFYLPAQERIEYKKKHRLFLHRCFAYDFFDDRCFRFEKIDLAKSMFVSKMPIPSYEQNGIEKFID